MACRRRCEARDVETKGNANYFLQTTNGMATPFICPTSISFLFKHFHHFLQHNKTHSFHHLPNYSLSLPQHTHLPYHHAFSLKQTLSSFSSSSSSSSSSPSCFLFNHITTSLALSVPRIMEESEGSASGSPITNMAQDYLITILLLLPIDAILSLSMTCKRFRSLTSSNTIWKSLCKRDLGSTCVEALLNSSNNYHHQFPWMRFYRQVSLMDSVCCHKLLSEPHADLDFPTARASHSLNFVSDCLVLFGGGCEGGRHLDDTRVAYIGNDFRRKLKWQTVHAGIPSGRFGHTCVEMGDFLVLFGGINDRGNRQNDTWLGQVVLNENKGIGFSWKMLEVGNVAPPPRGAHGACSIDEKRMIIHGGIGLNGLRLGDTWVLELSDSPCHGTWHEIVSYPSPPPRSGHTLTCIGRSRTILFGGRGLGYEVLDDVWLLDTYQGYFKWVQIVYDLQSISDGVSLPRVGHTATLVLGGRLLIYGGEDSYRHRKDDFWVLDISAIPYPNITLQHPTTVSSKKESMTRRMWKRWKSSGFEAKARSFHRACADRSGRYLYVFGGMVDGFLQPAEPSALRFDAELFLVELVLQL